MSWKWARNSCHLDTWLMSQLTLYAWLGSSRLTDSTLLAAGDTGTQQLFRVLLGLATDERDNLRDCYWAMECCSYTMGAGMHTRCRGFGQFDAVESHEAQLAHAMPRTSSHPQRKLVTMTRKTCTNDDHNDGVKSKALSTVYVANGWYRMPDPLALSQLDDGSWEAGVAELIEFRNMRDVLGNYIVRQGSGLVQCMRSECIPAQHYRTEDKLPTETTFPWFLTFATDNGAKNTVVAEHELVVAELTYTLVCVVFCNNAHFSCNFRGYPGNRWFHYDDMGSKMPRAATCNGGQRVHALPVGRNPCDPIVSSSQTTFYAVQWHYILTAPQLSDRQSVVCPASMEKFMEEFAGSTQHHEIAAVLENPDD